MSSRKQSRATIGLIITLACTLGLTLASHIATAQSTDASGTVHRFVLAAGSNYGGEERVRLQYAVSDADRFANVMRKMGGVSTDDQLLLEEPDLRAFDQAMRDLQDRVARAQANAGRTELVLYYSGHADETGLLLGGDRLSYDTLRDMLEAIPADVRISVLDACASGAITRIKGGEHRPAFMVDASSDMRGYAYLTSSSADESAQESDRIGASFFTHYLVSGMRGAADVSGDGKVTLGEAYQFAFHETLATTSETQGGAQHPAYHINLSGTGDVVMTDVREMVAGLVLPEDLDGRFYVRDDQERLVAELYKPAGRSVELGLEPGSYEILLEHSELLFLAGAEIGDGERLVIDPQLFASTDRESTTLRGDDFNRRRVPTKHYMGGRSAIGLTFGWLSNGPSFEGIEGGLVQTRVNSENLLVGIHYNYWVRESVAIGFRLASHGLNVETAVGSAVETQVINLASIMVETRAYILPDPASFAVRPFISGAAGAIIATENQTSTGGTVVVDIGTQSAFAGQVGGGLDIPLGRHVLTTGRVGYNFMTDFKEPVGGRSNYSGLEVSVGISFTFGKGF